MPATNVNLLIEQGIPFAQKFRAKNEDNTNKDLTGFTARMQFRPYVGSPILAIDATTLNGKLFIDLANSALEIRLTEADTQSLIYKQYVYDVELVSSGNVPLRFIQGTVTVSPEITRTV